MHIYHGSEIKAIDLQAEQNGLDTFTLMENAGKSIFEASTIQSFKTKSYRYFGGKGE